MISKERLEDIRILGRRFSSMKTRCYNKNEPAYKNYGGRGIKVCDEWMKNKNKFIEWSLQNGFRKELTIDRKNNNGDYEPNNCRWVDMSIQNNNKRNISKYYYNGESHTITEWAKIKGIPFMKLYDRLNKLQWSIDRALNDNTK